MGYKTSDQLGLGHFIDPHQKMGLALLILYVTQLVLGAFIHFVKMKAIFRGRRPPQNYLHVFLGLVILVVAASQVTFHKPISLPVNMLKPLIRFRRSIMGFTQNGQLQLEDSTKSQSPLNMLG